MEVVEQVRGSVEAIGREVSLSAGENDYFAGKGFGVGGAYGYEAQRRKAPFRDRQEITWTFECPIAPHLGSLLNRKIRGVGQLRLWFRSIGRDPI